MRFESTFLLLLIYSSGVFAAGGDGHHSSLKDLIAPTINVSILLGFLFWKLKKPLHDYFSTKSEEISNTLERANLKSKEAQIMLEGENRKVANLNNEIHAIHQHSENEIIDFEKKLSKETEEKTQKLKIDANSKIQADKKDVLDKLSSELLNQVISKTKTTIKTNKEFKNKVSTKLLQDL